MNEVSRFLALFSDQERTATIEKLAKKQFDEQLWIADAVYLSVNGVDDLQYFILDKQKCAKYESQFLVFGKATHSGSEYAFYKTKGSKNCDEWPIIVLGDEGGVVVLAKNIFDLMRFWTLNSVEPYVNTSTYRSFDLAVDPDFEESNAVYKDWIKSEFEIESFSSIEEAEREIIKPAIEEFQKEIDEIFKVEVI